MIDPSASHMRTPSGAFGVTQRSCGSKRSGAAQRRSSRFSFSLVPTASFLIRNTVVQAANVLSPTKRTLVVRRPESAGKQRAFACVRLIGCKLWRAHADELHERILQTAVCLRAQAMLRQPLSPRSRHEKPRNGRRAGDGLLQRRSPHGVRALIVC